MRQQAKQERKTIFNTTPRAIEQGLDGLEQLEATIHQLQSRGSESGLPRWAASRQAGRDPNEPTEEQLNWLADVMALFDLLSAMEKEGDANIRALKAADQELEASLSSLTASTTRLEADLTDFQRMGRRHRLDLHADKAALRVQAVKEDARLRALAHVGISRSAIAPDGKPWGNRITNLKENWGKAWWEVLDHQQKGEMNKRFGGHYMSFLEESAVIMDSPKAKRPEYPLSCNMPWAEKAYIMEAIDYLQQEAEKEGGRAAYMAFLGCKSWEDEMQRADDMLVYAA